MKDIRVALGQITCLVGNLDDNVEKHRLFAMQASEAGASIIAFPELSLSGYPETKELTASLAQPPDGELGSVAVSIAKEAGVTVVAGFLEKDPAGEYYNSQLVASPSGLEGVYRKIHVPFPENARFNQGNSLPVYTSNGSTFGVQICYDNHFPEAARTIALQGAEIIFGCYASPGPCTEEGVKAKHDRWLRYLTARAFDNSVFMAIVNQVGRSSGEPATEPTSSSSRETHTGMSEFPGGSLALNPWGEVIAEAKPMVEDLLIVDLDSATLMEKRGDDLQFFDNYRRPDLYRLEAG